MFFNELYNILKSVASAHSMVNTVEIGTSLETGTLEQIEYSYVFYEISTLVEYQVASEIYSLSFWVLERTIEDDLGNRIEMLSKTKAIGQEILYYLDINYENDFTIIKEGENSFTSIPLVDDFADRVVGWRFEFQIRIPTSHSYCNITMN